MPLFSDRPRRELDLISSLADIVDCPEGKELMREGDRGREFFALVEGTADVTRRGQLAQHARAGDFFGEIALVARMPRTATVTTTSPARVLVLTDQAFGGWSRSARVQRGARRVRRARDARPEV